MDKAYQGSLALEQKDYKTAIEQYTAAISLNPDAVDYFIKRSTAFSRISPAEYSKSLDDAERAVRLATSRGKRELIAQSQLRRAVALFGLERYVDARQSLSWVRKLDEKEKSLTMWELKTAAKIKEHNQEQLSSDLPELPETGTVVETRSLDHDEKADGQVQAPKTLDGSRPPTKARHEWYQQNAMVVITVYAKGASRDLTLVHIQTNSLEISIPTAHGPTYQLTFDPLFAEIEPSNSSYNITPYKVEVMLKKHEYGKPWGSLERPDQTLDVKNPGIGNEKSNSNAISGPHNPPAYPTSSRSGPKDWEKLSRDLARKAKNENSNQALPRNSDSETGDPEAEDDDLDDEGDAVNGFFKKLYKGANDDTRRAMMKSFQESNGTALSTNWKEVGKAKVETTPPAGMEAKNW